MSACRDCHRPLHQQVEKALSGESALVWTDDEGGWVCDKTGDEHVPGKTQVVTLEITTEGTNADPVNWNWAELLDCDPDLVRVVDAKEVS